ncbi:MAG: endogenous inhibitor of DNA gyrase (YacG/DUF329 family) [Brevundimonas sp.]|jgi:endogenous inhibitor of DNA gyrase (YacG/DUF329 family)|uniref:DNA gyrase inhibitor YacG n=1 Tax=Brevundimonas sp. TaxID=1871086 RepID=UPI00248A82E5|nr:DNA gyrase inhibitor YacG [Brevundimonas sp.]MDI1282309.1 DNA gyrase inhibitor YacG [Brevundimonas sp.]
MANCPICRQRPAASEYKPFCSKRCADLDLQRWFTGSYAIPAGPEGSAEDESEPG